MSTENERPEWLQLIIDTLEDVVEQGVELEGGRYIGMDGRRCVIGHLAHVAGVSDATLEKAGPRIIHATIYDPESDHRVTAVQEIRDAITEHFDGEAPGQVQRALEELQQANDAARPEDRPQMVLNAARNLNPDEWFV